MTIISHFYCTLDLQLVISQYLKILNYNSKVWYNRDPRFEEGPAKDGSFLDVWLDLFIQTWVMQVKCDCLGLVYLPTHPRNW